jgi:PIN domain nuclease of toxin-antitoxin system
LLVDTRLLLWAMADDLALSPRARVEIAVAEVVYASAASVWEISIKAALGKLKLDQADPIARLREAGSQPLPVTKDHAAAVRRLPDIHRDPFDRLPRSSLPNCPDRVLRDLCVRRQHD